MRGLAVSPDGTLKIECRVEDFSPAGARLVVNEGHVLPDPMYLIAQSKELGFMAAIIWSRQNEHGVRFVKSFPLVSVKTPELEMLVKLKLQRLRA